MTTTWNDELVEQLDWHWIHHARPRLDGMSDDEYLWEPVADCWNIRQEPHGGAVTIDFEMDEPAIAPFTTIAWRLGHISIGVLGNRAANHFGVPGSVEYETTEWPIGAAAGLAMLDGHYAAWIAGVRALGEEGLRAPCGPCEGPFSEHPMSALVLHINREVIHHMAEVAVIRDLYAHRSSLVGARS